MPALQQPPFITQLQDGVDAVLLPRGFAPGQVGTADEQGQVIWCAAADEFAACFPRLPTSREPADGWRTSRTDLVVDLAVTDGGWCVSSVDQEGQHLEQVLADLGFSAAARRATALLGSPAQERLTSLPSLLTTLLDGPRD